MEVEKLKFESEGIGALNWGRKLHPVSIPDLMVQTPLLILHTYKGAYTRCFI